MEVMIPILTLGNRKKCLGAARAAPIKRLVSNKKMTYLINKDAVIFLDVDIENNYYTIAYDFKSDDVVAIRPLEYRLLKYVFENEPVNENQLKAFLRNDIDAKNGSEELISKLLEKNILQTNG